MSPLKNKTALVTGASSGIGAGIAIALAQEGIRLGLAGRNADRLEETAAAAIAAGAQTQTYAVDLTNTSDLQSLKAGIDHDFGGVDILVHSAGIFESGSVEDSEPETLEHMLRVNTVAPYALTHMLLPGLRRRRGQIVFINSRAVHLQIPRISHYAASKAALRAIADSLRAEVAKEGVRVLSVYPGKVASAMQESIQSKSGRPYLKDQLPQPEDVAAVVVNALSLPPRAEISDLTIQPQQDPYS